MSMGALERRSLEVEVRAPATGEVVLEQDGLPRTFWARVVNYDVLDNYGTLFREGCFAKGLERRLPRLMYGHGGWENPAALVGKAVEYREVKGKEGGLDVKFQLDDFDFVPNARQIAYQMKEGTLDQFSVGFIRKRDSRAPARGGTYIEEAKLCEVSVLPEGSVPGTRVLSFRSENGENEYGDESGPHVIAVDDAVGIITRYSLGELDLVTALQAVVNMSTMSIPDEEEEDEDSSDADGGDDDGGADAEVPADAPEGDDEEQEVEEDPGETVEEPFVDEEAENILAEIDEVLAGRTVRVEVRRDFTQKERDKAAAKGQAMEGGGFPIKTPQDLMNAIKAIGRAKDPEAAKAHIIKRARALGLYDKLPKEWTS